MNKTPSKSSYDVVIIGGAIMGSSLAWWLTSNPDFDGSVLVVEADPTYEFSGTAHSNSCMRQQFSTKLNVQISQFAAEFVNNFRQFMDHPDAPDIPIQNYGYMYLADTPEQAQVFRENHAVQRACGTQTELLSADQIAQRYPFYRVDDILLGSINLKDEGYFDGGTVFDWWRKSAQRLGAEYLHNRVVEMTREGDQITHVTLESGERIAVGRVVNCSGTRAALTAKMAGIHVPIEPRRRYTFIFDAAHRLDRDLPLTIDPSGIHVRTDGTYYLAGCPPLGDDVAMDPNDFAYEDDIWEEKVWPAIASRIPQFEAIKLINSWVGHYAFNTLDQNAVLGPHPQVSNFLFLNGFSGHGLQQSPAMGRGVAEHIIYGEYRSLDLSLFAYQRIIDNKPIVEKAVI